MIAVSRQLAQETVIAVFNASRHTHRLDLPLGSLVPEGTILAECWRHTALKVEQGTLRNLKLAPRSVRIVATHP